MNVPASLGSFRHRGFDDDLSDDSFDQIATIAYNWAGLVMQRSKKNMVKSRLIRRMRALRITNFEDYCEHVCSDQGLVERRLLIGALTTNVSQFFREAHHFESLRKTALPPLMARAADGGKLRIWSAGCSNGQEPYSIAMTLFNLDPRVVHYDVRILATDIDPDVISFARAGRFPSQMMQGVPQDLLKRHFLSCEDDRDCSQFDLVLRPLVTFNELNLHEAWPMKNRFDIIFCRNVMIYFDDAMQERLMARFRDQLHDEGWLFLGHSERLPQSLLASFRNEGVTTLRKIGRG